MSKHTEAPWSTEYDNDTGPNDGYFVEWTEVGPCRIYGNPDNERVMANICLVKAAPYLYEHAEALLTDVMMRYGITEDGLTCPHMRGLAEALSKARGEK